MSVDFDPETRALCPDGSCIGVLDDGGRCKVCGTRGKEAAQTAVSDYVSREPPKIDRTPEPDADERELCPDGACIGLIGSDGKCKVCRTPRGS